VIVRTPVQVALAEAEQAARETRPQPVCTCEFADVGTGPPYKVAESPDCPYCTEFGYAVWAAAHGTDPEREAARAYLAEWEASARLAPPYLPPATHEDLVNPAVPRSALATAEGWQEWLAGPTGRMAWAGDVQVAETNFMARAKPGETTGGYRKSGTSRDGLAVWWKEASDGPDPAGHQR
jgi:hypothetical protein